MVSPKSNMKEVDLSNFVFTADWHIRNNHNMPKLVRAISSIRDYMVNHDVKTLIIGGDIFDVSRPTNKEQEVLAKCLMEFAKEDIDIIIIPGNHDMASDGTYSFSYAKYYSNLIGNLTIIDKVTVIKYEGRDYVFVPPMLKTSVLSTDKQSFAVKFQEYIAQDIDLMDLQDPVCISHFPLRGVLAGDFEIQDERILDINDLHNIISGRWYLGDIHKSQKLQFSDTIAVYPGSPERITFTEKDDDKGFLHVIGDEYDFISTDPVPMYEVEIVEKVNAEFLENIKDLLDKYKNTALKLKINVWQYDVGPWIQTLKKAFNDYCYSFKLDININTGVLKSNLDEFKIGSDKEVLASYLQKALKLEDDHYTLCMLFGEKVIDCVRQNRDK